MSERRAKAGAALLKFQGKTGLKIEFFPAELWDHPDADKGFYRLRVNGRWRDGEGGRALFFTPDAAFLLLAREALGAGAKGVEREQKIRRGGRVRVDSLDPDVTFLGFAASRPFVGLDGRARIFVCGYEDPFLLEDVRGLR